MRIEVYGRPMCDDCEIAINMLESKNIPYQYYNVENMLASEVSELISERAPTAKRVPVIFIEGRYIGDFNEFREFIESRKSDSIKLDAY